MDLDTEYAQDFNALNSVPAEHKHAAYGKILDKILANAKSDLLEMNLQSYLTSLLDSDARISGVSNIIDPLSIISLRPLLDNFLSRLQTTDLSNEAKISACSTAIQLIRPRVASFADQDTKFKQLLADTYEVDEDFTSSARVLQSIDLDNTQRTVTDTERAQIWVRIARCYLEEDDPTNASTYINRVKNVIHNVQDKPTRLQFQMSQARIYDSQRQFLDASMAYHNISLDSMVDEDDRLQTLNAAITCAVLAPAGPQRARTLARLYKDDRSPQTPTFPMLEKIFFDRVLSPQEVTSFSATLAPHQLAKIADGTTVLDRAVLEHNLLGASRLYANIDIENLGELLGVGGERAEQYAAQMIEQGRLAGHIDQIDRTIFFEGEGSGERLKAGAAGHIAGARAGELRRWDAAVQGLAEEVEKVATMIQMVFPDFYSENMAF